MILMLLFFCFYPSLTLPHIHTHTLGMKQADAQTTAADRVPDNHVWSDPVIFFNRSYKKFFVAFKRPQLPTLQRLGHLTQLHLCPKQCPRRDSPKLPHPWVSPSPIQTSSWPPKNKELSRPPRDKKGWKKTKLVGIRVSCRSKAT